MVRLQAPICACDLIDSDFRETVYRPPAARSSLRVTGWRHRAHRRTLSYWEWAKLDLHCDRFGRLY